MERMKGFIIRFQSIFFVVSIGIGLFGFGVEGWTQGETKMQKKEEVSSLLENVHWLGHSSIKISGNKLIYVDPFQIESSDTADIILITHDHYDHLSISDIQKIQGVKTTVIIPELYADRITGNVKTVNLGDTINVEGVEIQVVPSYNIGKKYHPQNKKYVGYVFKADSITYYHAGDTDHIPEMKKIHTDVAFLPVDGTFTMNPEQAAKAAKDINPKAAVPIHWGSIIGSVKDAEKFKSLCTCEVFVLKREK